MPKLEITDFVYDRVHTVRFRRDHEQAAQRLAAYVTELKGVCCKVSYHHTLWHVSSDPLYEGRRQTHFDMTIKQVVDLCESWGNKPLALGIVHDSSIRRGDYQLEPLFRGTGDEMYLASVGGKFNYRDVNVGRY